MVTAMYANPLAENGGESMARGTMIELGYEVPELQVEVPNPLDDNHPFRVDFMWQRRDASLVIGELDGMDKYIEPEMCKGRTSVEVMSAERVRESRLTIAGARVMRFHFDDVLDRTGFASILDVFGVPKEFS